MQDPRNIDSDEPVLASFRFGPSFRMFSALWWLMGPVPLALLVVSVVRGGDPVNLYIFLFFWLPFGPIWGLALWRGRIDITDHFVIRRRLRAPLYFERASTEINLTSAGGTPVARITDRHGTRQTCAVTSMRTSAREVRKLAAYIPVTVVGKQVEELGGSDPLRLW